MRSHPDYKNLVATLRRLRATATPFRGTLYRACDPTYANTRDLLTGAGSRLHGGRWNAPKSFASVYLAQSVEGAVLESLGVSTLYGFDAAGRLPLTLVAIDATLDDVINFTDAAVRRAIGVTLTEMGGCDWRGENAAGQEGITQATGRAAFALQAQGIIVPSAVKRTLRHLNVFPDNLRGTGRLKILGSERLPSPPLPMTS